MKNFVKKLISLLCLFCLSFAVFVPFILVNAEESTYYVVGSECSTFYYVSSGTTYYNGFSKQSGTGEIRAVIIKNSSDAYIYFVSESSAVINFKPRVIETAACAFNGDTYTLSSNSGYYVRKISLTSFFINAEYHGNIPVITSTVNNEGRGIYYTFGEGAVGPLPPGPVYGNLTDVSYSSNIAGSGYESSNNVDVIKWNNIVDNHNNLIPSDAVVDIRAIPGEYQASDKQSLLTKIYTDLILDYTSFATLANVPFSNGQKSFVWSDVVSRFGSPFVFGNFISMIQGESYWYKQGWIYEVRLRIPSEDFTGEWIGIRNLTSSGVENSNNAIDNNGLNSTLIQTINNVNNINSTENNNFVTNNYYYNEYPIPESSSDLSDLTNPLQAILDAILSIPRKIGEKIQEVLGNIYEWLFVYEFDIEDYEEQKERMLEESGAFGEILSHLETMKENIDSHNGSSYVPLITWSDVYVMDEIMIPAGTFNLGNLVADDPMRTFYLLYQTIVSGYLYFTLFRFLYKKIIKTLRT